MTLHLCGRRPGNERFQGLPEHRIATAPSGEQQRRLAVLVLCTELCQHLHAHEKSGAPQQWQQTVVDEVCIRRTRSYKQPRQLRQVSFVHNELECVRAESEKSTRESCADGIGRTRITTTEGFCSVLFCSVLSVCRLVPYVLFFPLPGCLSSANERLSCGCPTTLTRTSDDVWFD